MGIMKGLVVSVVLVPWLFIEVSSGMEGERGTGAVLQEDYGLYDRIIEDKFLTSQTQLVLLERMTVSRLVPNQPGSMTLEFFQRQVLFQGMLPYELIRDFVGANQVRSRLESLFRLAVRYRFVSGGEREDMAAHLAVPTVHGQRVITPSPSVLDRLGFSRVGRTPQNDQALVYVENQRRDGTGVGLLVWFHRAAQEWKILDTEVIWTIRGEGDDGGES